MWSDGWSAGTVIRQWYREDHSMPVGRWSAYQVAIPTDDGTDLHPGCTLIMVPKDTGEDVDKFCRKNPSMNPVTERRAVSAGRDCLAALSLNRVQITDEGVIKQTKEVEKHSTAAAGATAFETRRLGCDKAIQTVCRQIHPDVVVAPDACGNFTSNQAIYDRARVLSLSLSVSLSLSLSLSLV